MRPAIIAVLFVIMLVGGMLVYRLLNPEKPQDVPMPAVEEKVEAPKKAKELEFNRVIVASRPLAIGDTLDISALDTRIIPKTIPLEEYMNATQAALDGLVGQIVTRDLDTGELITRRKVVGPNDANFISLALAPNMRAITVATDSIAGVAGYIFPGDRIDIIITHNLSGKADAGKLVLSAAPAAAKSEVLIPNVKVLATNNRSPMPQPKQDGGAAAPPPAAAGISNLTLEVSPENAQRLRLAEKIGTLTFILRGKTAPTDGAPAGTTPEDVIGSSYAASGVPIVVRRAVGTAAPEIVPQGLPVVVTPPMTEGAR